jgi:hypothetical protein
MLEPPATTCSELCYLSVYGGAHDDDRPANDERRAYDPSDDDETEEEDDLHGECDTDLT